jgi:hypothetical protein
MDKKRFAKGVEQLINPIDVGGLHFIQPFNKLLPRFLQDKFIKSSGKTAPYMGFVVEPYAYFLCYEIVDLDKAKSLLPENFELIKTKIFDDDEPKFYCIFGCFTAHTSAFWGSRVEFYIIAEDKKTGLLSWIIVDYDSNTISYDHKYGLRSPNSSKAVVTTNFSGTVFVDIKRDDKSREIVFDSNVENTEMKALDQRLWLEGNLSIGYGRELAEGDVGIFSLKFDPGEVVSALKIPFEKFNLEGNSWYPGLFKDNPSQLVCFPYAQHFVSDSPGHVSNLMNKAELVEAVKSVDFENMKVFSTKSFKTMFMIGSIISIVIILTLFLLLIITNFSN